MKLIPLPSRRLLLSLLNYNKRTGVVTWKVQRGSVHAGAVAGCPDPRGYNRVVINGTMYYMHRVIQKMVTGKDPGNTVDHKDRKKSNNKWRNLRPATWSQQHMNKKHHANKFGVKGIRKMRGCKWWYARIYVNKKETSLGRFKTKREAISARRRAEKIHYKEFRRSS